MEQNYIDLASIDNKGLIPFYIALSAKKATIYIFDNALLVQQPVHAVDAHCMSGRKGGSPEPTGIQALKLLQI